MGLNPQSSGFDYSKYARMNKSNIFSISNATVGMYVNLLGITGKGFFSLMSLQCRGGFAYWEVIVDGVTIFTSSKDSGDNGYVQGFFPPLPTQMGGANSSLYMGGQAYSLNSVAKPLQNLITEPIFFNQSLIVRFTATSTGNVSGSYSYEVGVK